MGEEPPSRNEAARIVPGEAHAHIAARLRVHHELSDADRDDARLRAEGGSPEAFEDLMK